MLIDPRINEHQGRYIPVWIDSNASIPIDLCSGHTIPTPTGQTTVNKKAPIHYIISINDKVYRPL